ncbi:MAG TPA: hypothetical protein VFE09_07990 [Rubrobacteraceae bacterium]|nr:hypothetical protein [Rubrobacteraceae bacterium]
MGLARRASYGALGGFGGTLVLTGFRKVMAGFGAVGTTAPEQVVGRLEELGLLDGWSPEARRVLTVAAHLAYGVGTGTALGLLRRKRGGAVEEASVGSALGVLAWGAGWASWLPLAGVHLPPWEQHTPKVLLPILDHVVFGAVWGLLYRAVRPDRV